MKLFVNSWCNLSESLSSIPFVNCTNNQNFLPNFFYLLHMTMSLHLKSYLKEHRYFRVASPNLLFFHIVIRNSPFSVERYLKTLSIILMCCPYAFFKIEFGSIPKVILNSYDIMLLLPNFKNVLKRFHQVSLEFSIN